MKIMAQAIYTYFFSDYMHSLLVLENKKHCDRCFIGKLDHKLLFNDIYYDTILV